MRSRRRTQVWDIFGRVEFYEQQRQARTEYDARRRRGHAEADAEARRKAFGADPVASLRRQSGGGEGETKYAEESRGE